MLKRVITGIVFAVVLIAGTLLQGWLLRAILAFAMAVSHVEMVRAFRGRGHRPIAWVGFLYCACAVGIEALTATGVVPYAGMTPYFGALALCAIAGMAQVVFEGKPDFDRAWTTLFPLIYPGLFFTLLISMQHISGAYARALALALAFFTASVNDVFALFGGMRFGKHKLSPAISPKKTVEGSISGLIASVVFSVALAAAFQAIARAVPAINPENVALPPLWAFAILGLFAGALSQIGDLTASMIKRDCGIKDFGSIFPGHGGMMDRFDGILFCAAVCWMFFRFFGL